MEKSANTLTHNASGFRLGIARMRVHPMAIADPPLRSSYGLHAPYALRTIVELESEDGVVGLGETHGGDKILAGLHSLQPQVERMDAFLLLGRISAEIDGQPRSVSGERSQTYLVPGENPLDEAARLRAVLEIACLDLIGKSISKPVCDLLGARARDAVKFSAYAFYKHRGGGGEGSDSRSDKYGEALTPHDLAKQVGQMIAEYGFEEVKLKAGVLDPEIEMDTIRELRREFGPGVPLRLD